ncbi:MAG: HAD family hydrolase [Alistipes sp.]|nr:HAD family hydrolase [Alistipes sp.]
MKELVIFDLDGTLLNTIADLAAATNYALHRCGFPVHETDRYRFFVGNGIAKLFERALPEDARTDFEIARIKREFLSYYDTHNTDLTRPYDGIPKLLKDLHGRGLRMAVASNKYHAATCKLIDRYFPEIPFIAVFGQRDGVPVKPDPAVIREIMGIAGTDEPHTVFAGDSGVDMKTAISAGVTAIGVTWGFRPREELEVFSPQFIVDAPGQIPGILY